MRTSKGQISKIAGALLLASAAASPASTAERSNWLQQLDRTHARIDLKRHVQSYGEIISIDISKGTVTLQHVPLETPDKYVWMPVMSMVFQATGRNKLKGLQVGDWVAFEAVRLRKTLMVTNIKKFPLEGFRGNWLQL